MATKERIFLDKILKSEEFCRAATYQDLLTYLVEASLKGQVPKEITIAHDVFRADPKQEKRSNTKVRVYIHNLRKKLDSYYTHEGIDDEIHLDIPKGHYQVTFIQKSKKDQQAGGRLKVLQVLALSLLLISMAINIFLIKSNQATNKIARPIGKENLFWADYFKSDLPILIVFGDYFMYRDRQIPDRNRYIRDYNINSPGDLDRFLSENSSYQEHVVPTSLTYLGKLAPWCLYDLQSILLPYHPDFQLKLSSQLQWEDLNKYNIIFIGAFKTVGIFGELMKRLHFTYQIKPNVLFYHPEDADTSYSYHSFSSFQPSGPQETDYAVIAKFPGPMHNVITMFASTRDIGCLATVDLMTQPAFLTPFINDYLRKETNVRYFEAIYEVQGYERTVINKNLLHFNVIDSPQ